MNASDHAHSFGLRVKRRMAQESPDELRRMIIGDVEPYNSVADVRPIGTIEVSVQTEERRLRQAVQHGNQVLIVCAPGSHVHAHKAEANSPLTQQEPLAGG